MKKALIFCISLNFTLALALGYLFYTVSAQEKERAAEAIWRNELKAEECINMLEKAGVFYAEERYSESRLQLAMAGYLLYDSNESLSELARMGEWYFFDLSEAERKGDVEYDPFCVFVSALISMVEENDVNEEEAEMAELVRSLYENHTFVQREYPKITSGAEVGKDKIYRRARISLGGNAVIEECECSLFPPCHTFYGVNTYSSIASNGGLTMRMYFYSGSCETVISEEDAVKSARKFMRDEGIKDMELDDIILLEGIYYARFYPNGERQRSITVGVRGVSGRVCLFDAERYYGKDVYP